MLRHNPVAHDLRTPKYRPRVAAAKKGKGAYSRKNKRPIAADDEARGETRSLRRPRREHD